MASIELTVTAAVDQAIRRHGQETYPHECCGALVGARDDAGGVARVFDTVPLPNTTEEGPRRRFLVRPSDYQLAERRAAETGGELLGFYHSHPDGPARPSGEDLDRAWPNLDYIILSVQRGRPAELSCWRLRDDRSGFDREDITWPIVF